MSSPGDLRMAPPSAVSGAQSQHLVWEEPPTDPVPPPICQSVPLSQLGRSHPDVLLWAVTVMNAGHRRLLGFSSFPSQGFTVSEK